MHRPLAEVSAFCAGRSGLGGRQPRLALAFRWPDPPRYRIGKNRQARLDHDSWLSRGARNLVVVSAAALEVPSAWRVLPE